MVRVPTDRSIERADIASVDPPTHELRLARKSHSAEWTLAAVIAVLAAMGVNMVLTNQNLQWGVVWHYFHSEEILIGLLRTLELTAIAMVLGILLGTILAVMRLSKIPIISSASWAYIWFFRGTPLLVQIFFWYNLAFLTPTVSIGIPFGPEFVTASTNTLITPFLAAVVALTLCEAAFMAEIIRGGLQAIDAGQTEASRSLGLTPMKTFRLVILPQAMRVIVPPTGNEVINMLKTTALVSVIALPELLYSAQLIYAQNFQVMPLLIVASLWYLIVSTALTAIQYYIERHYGKGNARALPATPLQRLRRRVRAARGISEAW